MQNATFYTLLRTYAAQARRRGVSYGEQVDVLLTLRDKAIDAGEGSPESKENAKAAIRGAVRREYIPHDPGYVL